MPRGRIVLKRICESRKLAALKSDGARLLFTWLIPNVDVNGCFSGDPEVVKGKIFTRLKKSTKTVENYLSDLSNLGLILRYNTSGDDYLHITNFAEHQPHINPDREGKTDIPPPTPEQLRSNSGATPPQVKIEVKSKSKVKDKVKGKFKPPTFEEVVEYISKNPELKNVDPKTFWKGFNDSGWIDTRGNPVRNWKLKLRTWSSYADKHDNPAVSNRGGSGRNGSFEFPPDADSVEVSA